MDQQDNTSSSWSLRTLIKLTNAPAIRQPEPLQSDLEVSHSRKKYMGEEGETLGQEEGARRRRERESIFKLFLKTHKQT